MLPSNLEKYIGVASLSKFSKKLFLMTNELLHHYYHHHQQQQY